MPRLHHTKTRTGCQRCKIRKVKVSLSRLGPYLPSLLLLYAISGFSFRATTCLREHMSRRCAGHCVVATFDRSLCSSSLTVISDAMLT